MIAGKFFVLGGFDAQERILNSVLQLDIAANVCIPAPDMLSPRLACDAAVYGGRLLVAGGYNHEDGHLRCVEALDPREGKWQRVARMSVRRYDLGLAALEDALYAAGGCDEDDNCTAVVEHYEARVHSCCVSLPACQQRASILPSLVGPASVTGQ